jgi:hypothetical protein
MPELLTAAEFAARIKAKYPVYASLPDEELVSKMLAKYPEYESSIRPPDFKAEATPAPDERSGLLDRFLSITGTAAKDLNPVPLIQHVVEAGRVPEMGGAFSPMQAATNVTKEMGMAQLRELQQAIQMFREGRLSEGVGHTTAGVLPVVGPMAAGIGEDFGAGRTDEGLGHLLALAGGPKVTSSVLKGGAALGTRVATGLRTSAAQDVRQALAPTRFRTKVKTERILPGVQKRGLRGDLEDLQAMAKDKVQTIGPQIDAELQASGSASINLQPVRDAIAKMKAKTFRDVPTVVNGQPAMDRAVHNPRKYGQIEAVESLIDKYGADMTVDQAVAVRRAWDEVVSQAGGFDEKAGAGAFGVSLTDWSEANVKRPLAGALRQELAKAVPSTKALNKEFKFWKDLEDVVNATKNRKVGQTKSGLLGKLAAGTGRTIGAGVGYATGGPVGAMGGVVLGGQMAERLTRLFASPKWKLTASHLKMELADALASRNPGQISAVLGKIQRAQVAASSATPMAAEDQSDTPGAIGQR